MCVCIWYTLKIHMHSIVVRRVSILLQRRYYILSSFHASELATHCKLSYRRVYIVCVCVYFSSFLYDTTFSFVCSSIQLKDRVTGERAHRFFIPLCGARIARCFAEKRRQNCSHLRRVCVNTDTGILSEEGNKHNSKHKR